MSAVTPAQVSFGGGQFSRRLRARIDQARYGISLAAMVGFAPLLEGPMEAMPGTFHVATAPGECRLFPFEVDRLLGHVCEFSNELVRVYTNDALIVDGGAPVNVASPYTIAQVKELRTHESFDVLYCWHRDVPSREFVRLGATEFEFNTVPFKNGPFEPRNDDKQIRVSASAATGNAITLTANSDIWVNTDVGGLFRLEVEDFGDVTSWEPYITVTQGQLLTFGQRVYRVVGGNGATLRTGGLSPEHTEGVEWDGIANGTDINGEPAAGVRLEYIHDHYGIAEITDFTDARTVQAKVLRTIPFSISAGTNPSSVYDFQDGDYWDGGYTTYVPPTTAASYNYGTYRWAHGSFSDTRGWPTCGVVYDERLCVGKDETIYGSVRGDLNNFAELNEFGQASGDMAFIAPLSDPNPVLHLVPEDRLLAITASGVHAIGPSSAASGLGPGNVRSERQNNAGSIPSAQPVQLNSRTLYVDNSARRIYETDFDINRRVEQELDLTRYARDQGQSGFVELASQQQPYNHLWAVRGDGQLSCAVYLPEEDSLGFAERQLAPGMFARSICSITDPQGVFKQIWLAVEYGGGWHVVRMAPWRLEGEDSLSGCVLDMAAEHDGAPQSSFTLAHLPSTEVAAVADGVWNRFDTDAGGAFDTRFEASKVFAGLEFPAYAESLDFEMGGDLGPAKAKIAALHRAWIEVIQSRGLSFGTPATADVDANLKHLSELMDGQVPDEPYPEVDNYCFVECSGTTTRRPRLRVERVGPFNATIAGWGAKMNMERL